MTAAPLKISAAARLESESSCDEAAPRLVIAMDGQIVYANAAFEKMAGHGAVKGASFLDLAAFAEPDEAFRHSPLLFAAGRESLLLALRSGAHEVRFQGSGAVTELQFDIVSAADGARYIVASAPDAAGRTEESAGLLDHFLDLSSDLLSRCTPDGRIVSVNPGFTALLGFGAQELVGRRFLDLIHPDDHASVAAAMETGKDMVEYQCRFITNEARTVWMDWRHKKADGQIFSVGRDITAQKKHEQALQHRERQLSEAEAIGRMGHWHWHVGKQDIRFSGETYRIFGVTPENFKPTLESVGNALPRRDAERMMQAFHRAILEQNDHEIDFSVTTPSGDTRYVRCQGRCEFDASGDVCALYGIMQDVTQTVLHERALREAKDLAERAYAAKSQFLANMSHELRTPLNAIIGFSEMMQQQLLGPIGTAKYLDYISGIHESGEHLLDLITDILDMSKLEAGKYELDLEEINLDKTVRTAVHMVESRAAETGIRINVQMQEDDMKIVADRRAIMQIMLNLLSNAVKFSPPKSMIDVECVRRESNITLRVRDYGIGIPANKLPTITNPFEQVANQYTRSHEGSGLGLSITKELAELHGGTLRIESQVDVGTTVTIRLPAQQK